MIQKTYEIGTSLILIVTTLAFVTSTGIFMVVGVGYVTGQAYGSMNNMKMSLFMILITSLLFILNAKYFRYWKSTSEQMDTDGLEETGRFRRGAALLQKKDQPAVTD